MVFVELAGDFGLASPPKDPKFNERGFALWASFVSRYTVFSICSVSGLTAAEL